MFSNLEMLGPCISINIGQLIAFTPITFRSKAQPPQDMNGKYVVVWEKVGSDWKLAIDIWNSDR